MKGSILLFIDRWTDEVMPCAPTLEGWADWLSNPDPEWNSAGANHGDEFEASTLIDLGDVTAAKVDGRWHFDPPVPVAADQFFVRYGPGMGWDVEQSGRDAETALSECDDDEAVTLACMKDGPKHRLRFERTAEGPRMIDLGASQ